MRHKEINIKQQAQVTWLGCVLNKSMSVDSMSAKVANKIKRKLKFLFGINEF